MRCPHLPTLALLASCSLFSASSSQHPRGESQAPADAPAPGGGAASLVAGESRTLSRDDYVERMRGLWLGEVIANWTGLTTEGQRTAPPFYTDDDWGQNGIDFVFQSPAWRADDDTDIFYTYLHCLIQAGRLFLTPEEIADCWIRHINRFIWVSNKEARLLMGQGVLPPSTGLGTVNPNLVMIDAQLTTEGFGALALGNPALALRMADLPIRTTSASYATHAAQYFCVLYALALEVDTSRPLRGEIEALARRARRWIPDGSKTADAFDFTLAHYQGNPDRDDWESTRDAIHARYQQNAAANGFVYHAWYESTVNFATGIMALLYGGGDYRRSVQIGTLSGWDSDNPTATVGGLLGLIHGYDAIAAAFPGETFGEGFIVSVTRDALPDWTPSDPTNEDTFSLIAGRMGELFELALQAGGGSVSQDGAAFLLPPVAGPGALLENNPAQALFLRSTNNQFPRFGGQLGVLSPIPGHGSGTAGETNTDALVDGYELDFSGEEPPLPPLGVYSSWSPGNPISQDLVVLYDKLVTVDTIRFIEGYHWSNGGWCDALEPLVFDGAQWIVPPATLGTPLDAARPYQILDFVLEGPTPTRGIGVRCQAGGSGRFFTALELDALVPLEVALSGAALARPTERAKAR